MTPDEIREMAWKTYAWMSGIKDHYHDYGYDDLKEAYLAGMEDAKSYDT